MGQAGEKPPAKGLTGGALVRQGDSIVFIGKSGR